MLAALALLLLGPTGPAGGAGADSGSDSDLPCPVVDAEANPDGSVGLAWEVVPDADGYNVFRGEDFAGHLDGSTTSVVDVGGAAGEVLRYRVTATLGEAQSEGCGEVQVTAIPDLGSPLAAALALLGGLGALAWAGRRTRGTR